MPLRDGRLDRAGVAAQFLFAPEYRFDVVQALYGFPQAMPLQPDELARQARPDAAEVNAWVRSSWQVFELSALIAGSPEYAQKASVVTTAAPLLLEGFESSSWQENIQPNENVLVGTVNANPRTGGHALRVQLGQNQLDPVLQRRSADSAAARIAGLGVSGPDHGFSNAVAFEYWVRFDPDSQMADPGMKLNWLWGTRTVSNTPDEFNWYVKLDPNYGTFSLINNSPSGVGEPFIGYADLRSRGLSANLGSVAGGAELLGGRSAQQFFTSGAYVRMRIAVTLNDPGQANGKFDLWVGDVHVLHGTDVRYRDRAADVFSKFDVIGMYGGAVAPTWSFGIQVDDVSVYASKPAAWA